MTLLYFSKQQVIVDHSEPCSLHAAYKLHQEVSATTCALIQSEPTPHYSPKALYVLIVTLKTVSNRCVVKELAPHPGGVLIATDH